MNLSRVIVKPIIHPMIGNCRKDFEGFTRGGRVCCSFLDVIGLEKLEKIVSAQYFGSRAANYILLIPAFWSPQRPKLILSQRWPNGLMTTGGFELFLQIISNGLSQFERALST